MSESVDRIVVADAVPADVPAIVRMAAALSRQEREPDDLFDDAVAGRDLFGEPRGLSGSVARIAAVSAGMALWHPSYETSWAARGGYVVSLWVDEPFRRRGVARALLRHIARQVAAFGGVYLWWASKPGNRRAHATYAALGAGTEMVRAHALTRDAFLALARGPDPAAEFGPDD